MWDISEVGYDAEWHCIPASELGAHHHRDRVWIIAYPQGLQRNGGDIHSQHSERSPDREQPGRGNCPQIIPAYPNSKSIEKRAHGRGEYKPPIRGEIRHNTLPNGESRNAANTNSEKLQRREKYGLFGEGGQGWHELIARCFCGFPDISEVEPVVRGKVNGVPGYAHRLKALGNAVVPQIPEIIGRAIMEIENEPKDSSSRLG